MKQRNRPGRERKRPSDPEARERRRLRQLGMPSPGKVCLYVLWHRAPTTHAGYFERRCGAVILRRAKRPTKAPEKYKRSRRCFVEEERDMQARVPEGDDRSRAFGTWWVRWEGEERFYSPDAGRFARHTFASAPGAWAELLQWKPRYEWSIECGGRWQLVDGRGKEPD